MNRNVVDPEKLKSLHGKDYVEHFESNQSPLRLDRLISLVSLAPDMHTCDFGCGNGLLMQYICPQVATYTGVDFSEEFIAAANMRKQRLRFSNASFYCSDIKKFCATRRGKFDAAFAMDFSEHVYDKEWIEILKSIRASLRHSGVLTLHTPNATFFIEKMKQQGFLIKQFPEHVAVRNAEQNIELIRQAGFHSVKARYLPHYNVLQYFHPFSIIPLVGKYFQARLFLQAVA